jgi:hypothetical protein
VGSAVEKTLQAASNMSGTFVGRVFGEHMMWILFVNARVQLAK